MPPNVPECWRLCNGGYDVRARQRAHDHVGSRCRGVLSSRRHCLGCLGGVTVTLAYDGDLVRLVECPFCEGDLSDEKTAAHLESCEAFYRECGVEPPQWLADRTDAVLLEHAEGSA